MFERMRHTEWPLVIFTLALQLGAACAWTATLCDITFVPKQQSGIRALGLMVFPVTGVALLASLLHLGRPFAGWRALRNVKNSVLSREVWVSALFLATAAVYSLSWWDEWLNIRTVVGIVASVLGLLAIFSTSLVFRIPGQRKWNSWKIPFLFVSTAVMLSGLLANAFFLNVGENASLTRFVSTIVVGASAASLISVAMMLGIPFDVRANSHAGDRRAGFAYCVVLCGLPAWIVVRALLEQPTSRIVDVAVLLVTLAASARQRIGVYRSDRTPSF